MTMVSKSSRNLAKITETLQELHHYVFSFKWSISPLAHSQLVEFTTLLALQAVHSVSLFIQV